MGISSILGTDSESYNLLKKGIEAANTRGEVIANNIANVNTAKYKKFSVVFEDTLKNSSDTISLKTNNEKHIGSANNYGDISVEKDNSTSMRTDGNNVDLDVEKTNQAANTLKYNALVQLASTKITNTSYVITSNS